MTLSSDYTKDLFNITSGKAHIGPTCPIFLVVVYRHLFTRLEQFCPGFSSAVSCPIGNTNLFSVHKKKLESSVPIFFVIFD